MSHYDNPYKRRLRIVGTPDGASYKTTIHDQDTGKELTTVTTITITLSVDQPYNEAELTYLETDEQDRLIKVDGEVVEKKLRVDRPEIDITAYEK